MLAALALALFQEVAPVFSEAERRILLELSPVPEMPRDPTNAYEADPRAARLGQALFFDTRLSLDGTVSCATCHAPEKSWTDGKPLGAGLAGLPRHTMTLWNVAANRWFFWDGRKDTLWSQALGPLEDPREHGTSRLAIVQLLTRDEGYRRAYPEVFGALPEVAGLPAHGRPVAGEPEHEHQLAWNTLAPAQQDAVTRAFVNVGKSIAAFERLLVSRAAPFDRFVEGLRTGEAAQVAALSPSAQRGAALFVGKARCVFCHDGPLFSDLEFHDNRIPVGEEGGDPGRKLGIRRLRTDPLNSLGPFADDGGESGRRKVKPLLDDSHGGKQFKTPTLRNVARTAPYMHEGQFATLAEVVHFYDTLEGAAPESGNERLIHPLGLSASERADLVAFLTSLTDESLPAELLAPPPTPFVGR
jgi:cytochrome c peroxidase